MGLILFFVKKMENNYFNYETEHLPTGTSSKNYFTSIYHKRTSHQININRRTVSLFSNRLFSKYPILQSQLKTGCFSPKNIYIKIIVTTYNVTPDKVAPL